MKTHETYIIEHANDDVFKIDIGLIFHLVKRYLPHSISIGVVCVLLVGLSLHFYQEKYTSDATLMLSLREIPGVIKENQSRGPLGEGTGGILLDPFKIQEELLRNRVFLSRVYKNLQATKQIPELNSPGTLAKAISTKHPPGTEFLKISVTWPNPVESQQIANVLVKTFQEYTEEIELAPLRARERNLNKQLLAASSSLSDIEHKIENYQETHNLVNLDQEGSQLLNRYGLLLKDYEEKEAQYAGITQQIAQIHRQLNMDTDSAIRSASVGQSQIYPKLISELAEYEKEYNTKALIYTPASQQLKLLQEQIAVLKKQIDSYEVLTVGRKLDKGKTLILDTIRSRAVERLTELESQKKAIESTQAVLKGQIEQIRLGMNQLPEKQLAYAQLIMQQKHWTNVVERLKDNIAEVQLQQYYQRLFVLTPPSLPKSASFPNKLHFLLMAFVAGLALPTAGLVGTQYLRLVGVVKPFMVEEDFQLPVLAVLPWLKKHPSNQAQDILTGSYQSLALNVKTMASHANKKVFSLATGFSDGRQRSQVLVNLAIGLAQAGDKVLLLDANLRSPAMLYTLGESADHGPGLSTIVHELQQMSDQVAAMPPAMFKAWITPYVRATRVHPNVSYIPTDTTVEQVFELFNAKGFDQFVSHIKEHYDWVLFDAPSILNSAESCALLRKVDGLILLLERLTSTQHLKEIVQKVQKVDGTIDGVVMREPEF